MINASKIHFKVRSKIIAFDRVIKIVHSKTMALQLFPDSFFRNSAGTLLIR